jgi:hypothetical protein
MHKIEGQATSKIKSAIIMLPLCWNCPHALYKPNFGNGQILETQQVSQKEFDKMHKEHSAMVVSNNGSDIDSFSGFPFIIPH